jgi:hypothetical protein
MCIWKTRNSYMVNMQYIDHATFDTNRQFVGELYENSTLQLYTFVQFWLKVILEIIVIFLPLVLYKNT